MIRKQINQGEVIFREGEIGESFFQVEGGCVGIFSNFGTRDECQLTTLLENEIFGEMAVIEVFPRSATAVALEDGTEVTEIPAKELEAYFQEDPDRIMRLMKHLSKRLRELTYDYLDACEMIHEMYPEVEEKKRKEGFLERAKRLLRGYETLEAHEKLADQTSAEMLRSDAFGNDNGYAKKLETYRKGTIICREGDLGKCMYDIHWGNVGIYGAFGTPYEKKLTELSANMFFGEMGMIEEGLRSATAVAMTDDTTVEIIYPEDLKDLFEKNPPKISMILEHLSSRLRKLTTKYVDACRLIADAIRKEQDNEEIGDEMKELFRSYKVDYLS